MLFEFFSFVICQNDILTIKQFFFKTHFPKINIFFDVNVNGSKLSYKNTIIFVRQNAKCFDAVTELLECSEHILDRLDPFKMDLMFSSVSDKTCILFKNENKVDTFSLYVILFRQMDFWDEKIKFILLNESRPGYIIIL
jgi:hypothetical protein